MELVHMALLIAGAFTLGLGILHFFFPVLLDFAQAIPREGAPLRSLRLGPLRYATQRRDVYGIAWVMNHAASYTLVGIGLVNLLAAEWLAGPTGRWAALWIAGWWFLRAGSQFYLGNRVGDRLICAGFALLGVLHVWAVL